ncbi:MAG: SUMF1/EgtB/PvdO family nonheme iron enzyme, partial [Anaerolineae bacterium]
LAAGLAPDPAAFVAAVRAVNPVLAARCLTESGVTVPPQARTDTQTALGRDLSDPHLHLRYRIAAGLELGRLGDSRWRAVEANGVRILLPPLVALPAGILRMGTTAWQELRLRLGGFTFAKDETPQHSVTLPAFYVSRFPVTNAEFACFIAAGGYAAERYWTTPAARAWRSGEVVESGAVKDSMNLWRAVKNDPKLIEQYRRAGWSVPQVAALRELARMDEAQARQTFDQAYSERPRDRPAYWEDGDYNNPSQPVVGVTWFEALAYVTWLNEQWQAAGWSWLLWEKQAAREVRLPVAQWQVRLPSEAEWEWAARGPAGRIYPWGNAWDAGRANSSESHILRPTPVGIYADGATPDGVHDLAGNVWEWTTTLYRGYPYRAEDGRENLEVEGRRVVRGGSFGASQLFVRCASRYLNDPDGASNGQGFRVVLSPTVRL